MSAAVIGGNTVAKKKSAPKSDPKRYGTLIRVSDAFASALGPEDVLWLPDIYYAGGTAAKDISAGDYASLLVARGKDARHIPDKGELTKQIAAHAKDGDLVLVMGARDPSLPDFAAGVLKALQKS